MTEHNKPLFLGEHPVANKPYDTGWGEAELEALMETIRNGEDE